LRRGSACANEGVIPKRGVLQPREGSPTETAANIPTQAKTGLEWGSGPTRYGKAGYN